MKALYRLFLPLAIGSFAAFASCQDDEVLDLVTFPVNQPAITIDKTEGVSQATLKAVYKPDGTLQLNGLVSRTYTFHIMASPEDATINFDIINSNIPAENIEISSTKVVLPAGHTDASVTVTLKNEDFSFAAPNYDATIYELGVKATVQGYKMGTEPMEAKVIVEKEAYVAACSIIGESGNEISFERTFVQNTIINTDPISYTFKMKLDKPARKEVKVKLATTGIDDNFLKNVTITPAEITIPAGELLSADVTWSITDDFLLTTTGPEIHKLLVTASIESEDPVVQANPEENILTVNVNKVFRNFEYIADEMSDWVELSKTGWSVQLDPTVAQNGNILIDGRGGEGGNDVYKGGDFWFTVDMKSEKTISGFGIDYYKNSTPSSPKKVIISTSMDNVTWVDQGAITTPQSANHYFHFFTPVNTRYVKVKMEGRYNSYIDLTEIYVYNAQ